MRINASLRTAILSAAIALPFFALQRAHADPATLTIHADQPGIKMSPTFYGLMTEEINYSYDGGLYGELIQNRIFENTPPPPQAPRGRGAATRFASPPTPPAPVVLTPPAIPFHWSVVAGDGAQATIATDAADPVNATALKLSLKLDIKSASDGHRAGVANDGFWGIPVKPNTTYHLSFYARPSADFAGPLTADIESADGTTVYATTAIPALSAQWEKYTATLKTADVPETAKTRFVISAEKPGQIWLSLVSLFPPTFNDRPNGNRIDLMQLLGGMHPDFLRFPGGNYLEGQTISQRFNWKQTIGPLEDRPGHESPWRYRSSDGLGLLEFLDWCEDLHMQPVLAVYAGYSLGGEHVTGAELQPFVQDALDEIEYVTGDATTHWGAERAKDGHPDPFKLTYVEIGNEDNLDRRWHSYNERFAPFFDAIRAKYPNLQLISTDARVASRKPDVIDDHYYRTSIAMQRDAHHYDKTDRNGPKIFVGEWASREGRPTPNLNAALGDAAWLTGLERNSDVVVMQCYAPLLVNINPGGMQWPTDLIGYDTLNSYGSPSYYVQKTFSENRGDTILPVDLAGATEPTAANRAPGGIFATAARDTASGDLILKVVNTLADPQPITIDVQGAANVSSSATALVITGKPADQNSIADPRKISPKEADITDAAAKFTHEFPAYSVSVIRLKTK